LSGFFFRVKGMTIRHSLGLRLDPVRPVRDQIHEAAQMGARGVVLDASAELAPHRLGATGRRELRHVLRTTELSLIALSLPTRRAFDTDDQLDDRIRRADAAFALAYELGTTIVLARAGAVPPPEHSRRGEIFTSALLALGQSADHRGVRLAMETGTETGEKLAAFLDAVASTGLAASLDPASLLQTGIDPVAAARELGSWVVHAYANDATAIARRPAVNPRGLGFPRGALDWAEFFGALEEIGYGGFLTIWPAAGHPAAAEFQAIASRLHAIG
jgi:sugar phosphate isomerase/epimerase